MAAVRKKSPGRLPERLKSFFWEYHFWKLSWERDRHLIIARLLEAGDLWALRWLRRRLGDDALRAWLIEREGRGLSRQQLRLWELLVELPSRLVNTWLSDPRRALWDNRYRE